MSSRRGPRRTHRGLDRRRPDRDVISRLRWGSLAASLMLAIGPGTADAQLRGPEDQDAARALKVGARVGYDVRNQGFYAGTHLRIPVDPWRRVELLPGASVDVLTGIKEYTVDGDAVVRFGPGRYAFAGGGITARNTVYPDEEEREWRTGWNLVLGIESPGGPLGTWSQVEVRLTNVDEFDPWFISIGLNLPLVRY